MIRYAPNQSWGVKGIMSQPIITGKLTVPPCPAGYLSRPRLEAMWEDWRGRRLVLITAGAGFGKTSLLSAFTKVCTRPVFWYTLDEMDADPAVLRDHLLAAVSKGSARGTGNTDQDLAETVRYLRKLSGGSAIVLDDLQLAAGSRETFTYLERFVRYLPDGHTLTLASREPLDLATMKLRTQGVVAELRAADLTFRADEAAALFATRYPGLELDDTLTALVIERTEGWAAGLEILLQALEGSAPDQLRTALARLQEAGSGWFSYFAEEVLDQLPDDKRAFMRRSSLLPRLDKDLCDAALGIEDSGRLLADLCRRNLFTVKMGSDRGGYRYHHLFRDFLGDVQTREGTADESLEIRRRAARILETRGEWGDAMLAHAESGNTGAALTLLEKKGGQLLESGRHETIGRALSLLPKAALAKRAPALEVLGRVQETRGDLGDAVATYRRALPRAASGRHRVELMRLTARVMMRQSEFQPCINLCHKALREPARIGPATRVHLLEMIGISMCDLGRLDEGETHLLEAREAFGGECRSFAENSYY